MNSVSAFDSSFFDGRREGNIAVLTLTKTQLTDEENLEQLDHDLMLVIESLSCRQIVIDMQKVAYLTSSALGKLIALHRRLGRMGGRLVLCAVAGTVEDILRTSHLYSYFSVTDNQSDAIAALT